MTENSRNQAALPSATLTKGSTERAAGILSCCSSQLAAFTAKEESVLRGRGSPAVLQEILLGTPAAIAFISSQQPGWGSCLRAQGGLPAGLPLVAR